MNISCAIIGGGLSTFISLLPLTVAVRKEERYMARAMFHIQ